MNALQRIYEKAALCRAFEEECARRVDAGQITCPVYLSTGQEYVAATVATWCEDHKVSPQIFVQHRAHSVYLAFGGDPGDLVRQILFGMEGSNCIQSVNPLIYGHDAMLGSQVPIAVGACYGNLLPTVCFLGDAAAEEDYALAAFGWAATQRLPILFVVEDNGLSILTETKVRRSWSIEHVARGFGLSANAVSDDPRFLYDAISQEHKWRPALLNVRTSRLRWHSGAGTDGPAFDRHRDVSKQFHPDEADGIRLRAETIMREAWDKHSVK